MGTRAQGRITARVQLPVRDERSGIGLHRPVSGTEVVPGIPVERAAETLANEMCRDDNIGSRKQP